MSYQNSGRFLSLPGKNLTDQNANVAMHFPTFDFGANKQKLAGKVSGGQVNSTQNWTFLSTFGTNKQALSLQQLKILRSKNVKYKFVTFSSLTKVHTKT